MRYEQERENWPLLTDAHPPHPPPPPPRARGPKKIIRLESCLPDEVDVLASEPESSFWLCYSLLYRPEGGKSGVGWGGGIGLNFHFFWFRIFHDGLRQHKKLSSLPPPPCAVLPVAGRPSVRPSEWRVKETNQKGRRWCRVIEIQRIRERRCLRNKKKYKKRQEKKKRSKYIYTPSGWWME
jgi:hypothetical protein